MRVCHSSDRKDNRDSETPDKCTENKVIAVGSISGKTKELQIEPVSDVPLITITIDPQDSSRYWRKGSPGLPPGNLPSSDQIRYRIEMDEGTGICHLLKGRECTTESRAIPSFSNMTANKKFCRWKGSISNDRRARMWNIYPERHHEGIQDRQ